MDRAFASSLGNDRDSVFEHICGSFLRTGCNSFIKFANHGFHFAFVHSIAQTTSLSLAISFFCGFVISHLIIPPVRSSQQINDPMKNKLTAQGRPHRI
jgi:hypothetical protein